MTDLQKKSTSLAIELPISNWKEQVEWINANKFWLRKSAEVALRILDALHEKGWKKARLAREMGISPQQVSKYVRSEENFKLETLCKLEKVLGIELIRVLQADELVVTKEEVSLVNEPSSTKLEKENS
jgi:ribosome-binding protein aMBF1 (putative translation factor)